MDTSKVVNRVVDKIREAINDITGKEGEFRLVIVIPNEPNTIGSKATLMLSAPWLDEKSPKQAIRLISDRLKESLTEQQFSYIERITVINSSDEFVRTLNQAFHVENSVAILENTQVHGVYIEQAFLIVSQKLDDNGKNF